MNRKQKKTSPAVQTLRNSRVLYDVLYGFIPITEWEQKIINTAFFQRLRWIKQLGFSNYIFPGAEHNRFIHAVGVMHSMDQMLRALGLAVRDEELFGSVTKTQDAMLHKCLRISALLHDIGTFPFSHAIEHAYIRHGRDLRRNGSRLKELPNSHEHLGSFIIKNTDYPGGITKILKEFDLDVNLISHIIKGDSPYLIANQLMHSDLDADRMDYLMRDSYFTGIKYGQFDRDYLLANLVTFDAGKGQIGFGVRENALTAAEDFLIARFNWYTQIIRNPGSAKFDVVATALTEALLDEDLLPQFQDLLEWVDAGNRKFFFWSDVSFLTRCQEVLELRLADHPKLLEMAEMIVFRKPPKTIRHPDFEASILKKSSQDGLSRKIQNAKKTFHMLENKLAKKSPVLPWILMDLPEKEVGFSKSVSAGKTKGTEKLRQRDPIKIIARNGKVGFLEDYSVSLLRNIDDLVSFIPSVYGNTEALRILNLR